MPKKYAGRRPAWPRITIAEQVAAAARLATANRRMRAASQQAAWRTAHRQRNYAPTYERARIRRTVNQDTHYNRRGMAGGISNAEIEKMVIAQQLARVAATVADPNATAEEVNAAVDHSNYAHPPETVTAGLVGATPQADVFAAGESARISEALVHAQEVWAMQAYTAPDPTPQRAPRMRKPKRLQFEQEVDIDD